MKILKPDVNRYVTHQEEAYSNYVKEIATAVTALGGATKAVADRKRSEVKQLCGRKPFFDKGKKAVWQKCVSDVSKKYDPELQQALKLEAEQTKTNNELREAQAKTKGTTKVIWASVAGGALLLVLIFGGSIVYKKQAVPLPAAA